MRNPSEVDVGFHNTDISPQFTVFTPTYNRAHTLPAVYESLCKQTFRDFEWLIVDDGSTDGTLDLINSLQAKRQISVRYFFQKNQGKHVAFNRGVQEAHGKLFLTLDSDDVCVPHALEIFYLHWQAISETERDQFSGVTCLCMDSIGRIIGTPFPADVMDSDPITMYTQHKVKGDKWGFHRTEILRRYPYPVLPGEHFVPEGLVWNRVAICYKLRFVNDALRIVTYYADGLSAKSKILRIKNPLGSRLYYFEFSLLPIPIQYRLKAIINYFRFSLHSKVWLKDSWKELGNTLVVIPLFAVGYFLYLRDRRFVR